MDNSKCCVFATPVEELIVGTVQRQSVMLVSTDSETDDILVCDVAKEGLKKLKNTTGETIATNAVALDPLYPTNCTLE